ncbi:MAG: AAA family ATPase [Chloroflexi bacterium]|nr:AAA family ATPase [Chloroflexota bacterium]
MIEEIHLTSFKGFHDYTLKCSPFTILVGPNSSGKTSILQAIQFLHQMAVFVFGGAESPSFANPQWTSNPSRQIQRFHSGDPDAIWLNKTTSEPCKVSAKLSNNYEMVLEIVERNRYIFDVLKDGVSTKANIANDTESQNTISSFFDLGPLYVPPVGSISPVEAQIPYPQLAERIDRGQISEVWRNRIYWLWNDGRQQEFDEITAMIQEYLPNTAVLRPRMTHDSSPQIKIEFQEEGITFDISISGGGLRTLLNLAVVLRSSGSKCFLLDEPDAHLHGSLQRAMARLLFDYAEENHTQVFVATHAPDFIAEVPVESLVWINRDEKHGIPCNEIGRFLVDLGAVTNSEAIRGYGANKILFLEGSVDRTVFSRLLERSSGKNPFTDSTVIIAKLPNGKSDSKNLHSFQRLLRDTFKLDVRIACIVDNDYGLSDTPVSDLPEPTAPIVLSLERKEIENYLLDTNIVHAAAAAAAEKRQGYLQTNPIQAPSIEEIDSALSNILDDTTVRNSVKHQVIY